MKTILISAGLLLFTTMVLMVLEISGVEGLMDKAFPFVFLAMGVMGIGIVIVGIIGYQKEARK